MDFGTPSASFTEDASACWTGLAHGAARRNPLFVPGPTTNRPIKSITGSIVGRGGPDQRQHVIVCDVILVHHLSHGMERTSGNDSE